MDRAGGVRFAGKPGVIIEAGMSAFLFDPSYGLIFVASKTYQLTFMNSDVANSLQSDL